MPVLPAFQELPLHIAQAIAKYCIPDYNSHEYIEPDKINTTDPTWMVFYDVSYSWRLFALKHFYKQATIAIAVDSGSGKLSLDYLPNSVQIDGACYGFIKYIAIKFTAFKDHSVRESFVDLGKTWPDNVVFSLANSLRITVSHLYYQQFEPDSAARDFERFKWITQSLPSSIPNLRELVVRDTSQRFSHLRQYDTRLPNTRGFLWTVFGNAMSADSRLTDIGEFSNYLLVQDDMGPTGLVYDCKNKDKHIGYILEKTAPFLQSLKLLDFQGACTQSLVISPSDKPITYPRLQRFEYRDEYRFSTVRVPKLDESIVPFPALRHLVWASSYVFKDDALFRGNSGSLEYLDIALDHSLLDILPRYQVFSDGKYSQLSHVYVRDDVIDTDDWGLDLGLVESAISTMCGPKIQSLTVNSGLRYWGIVSRTARNPYSASIRILDIGGVMLLLPELFELVYNLPNLTLLRLKDIDGLDAPFDDTIVDGPFINDMYSKYYPLSSQFKFLEVSQEWDTAIFRLEEATLLFAILCPNFTRSTNLSEDADSLTLGHEIANVAQSRVYDGYMDKIQRFLPI